ncbi:uncharacterized protein LOC101234390 isoform X1 [Hydra vulgaris]
MNDSLYPEFVHRRMQEWKTDPSFSASIPKIHSSNKFKSQLSTNSNNRYTTSLLKDDTVKSNYFSQDSFYKEPTRFDENRSYLTFQKPSLLHHSQIKIKEEEDERFFPFYSTPNKMDYERKKIFSDSLKLSPMTQGKSSIPAKSQIYNLNQRQAYLPTDNQMYSPNQSKNYMSAEDQVYTHNQSQTFMSTENEIKILPQLVGIAPDGRLVLLPMSSPPLNSMIYNKFNYEVSTNSSNVPFFKDISNDKAKSDPSLQIETEFSKEHIDKSIIYQQSVKPKNYNKDLPFNHKEIASLTTKSTLKERSNSDHSLSGNLDLSGNHDISGNLDLSGNHDLPGNNDLPENHSFSGCHLPGNRNLNNEYKDKCDNVEKIILGQSHESNALEKISNINQTSQAVNEKIDSQDINQYSIGDHTENQYPADGHISSDKNTESHSDLAIYIENKSKSIANKSDYKNDIQLKSKNCIDEPLASDVLSSFSTLIHPESTDLVSKNANKSEISNKNLVTIISDHQNDQDSEFLQPQNEGVNLKGSVLITLLELIIEQVESNIESFSLNLTEEFSLVNFIISSLVDNGNTKKCNVSENFMALRYCFKMFILQNEKIPFFIDSIDKEINFEGDLRDCVNELFLEVWDLLFTFMVIFVSKFPFQLEQLADIIAHLLVPMENEAEKLKDVLIVILSDSMESISEFNDESINESYKSSIIVNKSIESPVKINTSIESPVKINTSNKKFIANINLSKVSSINKSDLLDIEDDKFEIKQEVIKDSNKEVIKDSVIENEAKEIHNNEMESREDSIIEDEAKEAHNNGTKLKEDNIIEDKEKEKSSKEEVEKENIIKKEVEKENSFKGEKINNKKGNVKDMKIEKEISLPPIDRESLIDLKYDLSSSESESESSVSFDSDGMPVVKTPTMESNHTKTPVFSEFSPPLSRNEEVNVDISSNVSEKSHQNKLISTHKDEDSDDDIDMLMNESLNISKRSSNTQKEQTPKQNSKMIDWNDKNLLPTESKVSEKLILKKPGFWDESESDSDVPTPPILSSKRNNDEDDFDFDFYD